MLEIDSIDCFYGWLGSMPARCPAAIQNLDLGEWSEQMRRHTYAGSVFLGCTLEADVAGLIASTGGIVIPNLNEFRFQLHRTHLYSPDEIFAGFDPSGCNGYQNTFDYQVYEQYIKQGKRSTRINISLARALHDHSITDALDELINGRKVVAVMGGHGMERGEAFYKKIALMTRTLTQEKFLVATGGGPGAMEAAHLGAYFATRDESELLEAIEILKVRPAGAPTGKEYADADWLHRAMKVRSLYPIPENELRSCTSVGVPTWFYGHEPPAAFSTHIAKYFANSIREDGLLEIARHGIVFAPGSAGTTQEIFQDAAQNHYGTVGVFSPMILFGVDHWTNVRPVWPLLKSVATGLPYGELLALTDDSDEILNRLRDFTPVKFAT